MASHDAEGEWRWVHDQDAYQREVQADTEARGAKQQRLQHRYDHRLKSLTWEIVQAETLFTRWEPSPPFPSVCFRDALRLLFRDATRTLAALGQKPPKKSVREILRSLVAQINRLDVEQGHVIETEEREDIHEALHELAFLSRHPKLVVEMDTWRTW